MLRLALLVLALTVPPAFAQGIDPAILRAMQGSWLIAPQDGRPGCRVTLRTEVIPGGYALALGPDCTQRLPRLADVAGWNPVDGLKLIDARRRNVMEFREREDGQYDAPEPSPGYALLRAPDHVTRLPMAPEAFGTWLMKRPDGEVVCRVQLLDRPPPGGQESYAVRVVAQGCQSAVTRLKLVSWRMEMLKLVLYGLDGNSLSFVQTPTGFAKTAAEGGRPLILERAPR
ncbi:MAG: protease inhibitor Inh/omp19 family protein [Proteobacteria bacterium]|nr:protease inhibitor Inh/omp19 family protein [Pseudomonadota bacterium]